MQYQKPHLRISDAFESKEKSETHDCSQHGRYMVNPKNTLWIVKPVFETEERIEMGLKCRMSIKTHDVKWIDEPTYHDDQEREEERIITSRKYLFASC
jgi:hypothetical protein